MDLRTGNEQLRRVNVRIDSLVEDIRTELLARDDTSKGLNDKKIKSLLKYIANPLKNITIDGNEMMLDDVLDLYDLVISELDRIVQDKKYDDDKRLSGTEVATFAKARDLLKADKENGIDVIDQVYTEIIQEHRSGDLEKTYIGRKKVENKEIDEINQKIYALGTDISKALRPSLDMVDKLKPELEVFISIEKADAKMVKIDSDLAKIARDRLKPDLSDEEKEILAITEESLSTKKIDIIKRVNPEFQKETYDQQETETISEYAQRLATAFQVQKSMNEDELSAKLIAMYGEKVNIAELDTTTNTYKIKEVNFKDRYFPTLADGDDITSAQMLEFSKKFREDIENLQTAMDAKIDEKTDLEAQKKELEEQLETEIRTSTLTVVPYVERENGEQLSEFAKWRQRMVFRFKNPKVMFMDRKEVEDAMCKAKIKDATIELDKTKLLKDIENDKIKFKTKIATKTKARSKIYKAWDENRIPNSRDDGSR